MERQNLEPDDIDKLLDISLEEFDSLTGKHEFSGNYKRKKKNLLKNLHGRRNGKRIITESLVATLFIFISTSIIVNAATDGELFARLWGSRGHKSANVHTELVKDEEKDMSELIEFPKRKYEETDTEKALELVGAIRQFEPFYYTAADGTIISVTSMISDGSAAVAEIIMENENGIQGFVYSDLYNESKGAYFSTEAAIDFSFDCGQFFYVDLNNSTPKRIVIYTYIPLALTSHKGDNPDVKMFIKESPDHDGKAITESVYLRPAIVDVMNEFSGKRGNIDISPISMKIRFDEYHTDKTYSVRVIYKDGSEYDVFERSTLEVSNDKYIDNTAYNCGFNEGYEELYIFNRLVDVDSIERILINDEEYLIAN